MSDTRTPSAEGQPLTVRLAEALREVATSHVSQHGKDKGICYVRPDTYALVLEVLREAEANAAVAAVSPHRDRTPADFAIEHAEYLAQAAESLLSAANRRDELKHEDAPAHMQEAAREAYSDNFSGLHNAVYEFRKRAERAKAAPSATGALDDTARLDFVFNIGSDLPDFLSIRNWSTAEDFRKAAREAIDAEMNRVGSGGSNG